jgi:hypothetical protein
MKSYLLVEGPTDAILLRPLVAAAGIPEIEIIDAGGKSSAMSLGSSIALSRASPVAVLVDADTTDKRSLDEQQLVFADLQRYAPPEVSCRLFLAVPTLEEDLFPSVQAFADIYGLNLTERQRAKFQRDRKAVFRAFYSVPDAEAPTAIRHGSMDWEAAKVGWGNKLLAELFEFLRPSKKNGKSEYKRPI